jgi:peptidoglycan/LPS O-acetylase OafA/YrhL
MQRIRGLDSIRAVLAFWVVMNHVGCFPLFSWVEDTSRAGWALHKCYELCFNGQAAVIGFFVLSGFFIHYPHRKQGVDPILGFYLRRHIRVGIPLLATLALMQLMPPKYQVLEGGVLWSVYAEMIYYTLYPVILRLRNAIGWRWILTAAYLATPFAIVFSPDFMNLKGGNYHGGGVLIATILGFPCWLLGCLLAETFEETGRSVSRWQIWSWRFLVLVAAEICYVLRFTTYLQHPITLDVFAVLVYFWLRREIWYYRTATPTTFLEWVGTWSYSLYLMHFFGSLLFHTLLTSRPGTIANWFQLYAFVVVVAYGFYLLIERPSHFLARTLARQVRSRCAPLGGVILPREGLLTVTRSQPQETVSAE